MIDHVALQVADLSRSREFYAQLLAPLGIAPTMELGEVVGFFAPDGHNVEAVCHKPEG